ncbi:MAG: hypothetical protein OXC31_24635, partial [Spirochaetaceae bacterium]|nr:hypothetical protein [Spirochaetaceae bacterium]
PPTRRAGAGTRRPPACPAPAPPPPPAWGARRPRLREIARPGLIATPLNSGINELVVEAARQSLASAGATVHIDPEETPGVEGQSGRTAEPAATGFGGG